MRALEYLLNFRTNKATLGSTNQDVKSLRENITGIGTSFNKVHGELTKFANSQKWANITTLTQNVAGGVIGIARNVGKAFSTAFEFVDQFAAEGDKVAKSARLVGMSVKDYQAFAYAAERSGVSMEQFNSGLQRFSVTLGKARAGDKSANQIFSSLLPGKLSDYKSEREIILAMSDSYTKLSESQRNFVSQSVFGRSGLQFGELLSGGSGAVDELLNRFTELGGGFDDEMSKRAEKFKDSMTDVRVTLNSMRVLVGSELLPVFNEAFGSITEFFIKNRGELQKTFRDFATSFVAGIKQIVPKIPSILSGVKDIVGYVADIVEFIGPIKTILGVGILGSLGSIMGIVTSLVGLIGGPAVAAIGLAAAGITSWGIAIKSVYDNAGLLEACFFDIVDSVKSGFEEFFGWISDGFENAIGKGIANGFRNVVKSVPILGRVFSDVEFETPSNDIGGDFANMTQRQGVTNTSRFSVDFKNMPKGVKVNPPKNGGDFDYSYGYVLGGI